ncbi:MAG: type II secretion system protein GspL, partial [Gammaproteobacteria bacterium]|nr:type II secretion system protein GspL [Gammaproteobacteria bacterium]
KMQIWMDMLKQHDIQPKGILPDFMLSPTDENSWCLYCENSTILVRTGLNEGFSCNRQNMASFLQRLLSNAETPPQQIKAYHCQSFSPEERTSLGKTLAEFCKIEFLEAPDHILAMIMHSHYQSGELNLLQGDFKSESQINTKLKPWRSVAVLAAVWLIFVMAMDVREYFRLQNQNEMLDQEIIQVFRKTFPDVKRVDQHKVLVLMRQNMAKLRGTSNKKGATFEEMLAEIGPLTRTARNLQIQQLRYQQGQLELLLELPDLQTLESFKQTLSSKTSWQVELKTANSSDNKVQGRILIHSES